MIKAAKLAALIAAAVLPAEMTAQAANAAAAAPAAPAGQTAPSAVGGAAALPGPRTTSGPSTGLTYEQILKPSADSWPTFSGDYSGQRYSPLTQINASNLDRLTEVWRTNLATGGEPNAIVGGDPRGTLAPAGTGGAPRGASLLVDGVLYTTTPDNTWAIDARTGKTIWHFAWKTRGGTHIGNRGVGIWGDYLFFETPDDYLVSLDRKTGKERWHVEIAPLELGFFSTPAPTIIKNHVIVGTGNDAEQGGFLQSFDPVTGERQWIFHTTPQNEGDPGLETWKNLDYARHGGGLPWVNGSYDPETNLYIFGTSEPKPAYFAAPRGDGDALYTASQIALDVDTGKMKWYYQTSPGETHDWDSAQTPILANITWQGKLRKVMVTASRNGYFFVVDRLTGQHLLTSKFNLNSNWAKPELNAKGQPVGIRSKDNLPNGALVSTPNGGSTNWPPAAYSPKTGLFYLPVTETYAEYYTTEGDPRGNMGLGGKSESGVAGGGTYTKAIDPKTGRIVWSAQSPPINPNGAGGQGGGSGLLVTASNLVFGGSTLIARDALTGRALWTKRGLGGNAPETYMLDGKQYILAAAPGGLVALALAD